MKRVVSLLRNREHNLTKLGARTRRGGAARHPVVTSQSASGRGRRGEEGEGWVGRRGGRMAGGKKHGEDRLNVANVNYASGVPGVPEGPR